MTRWGNYPSTCLKGTHSWTSHWEWREVISIAPRSMKERSRRTDGLLIILIANPPYGPSSAARRNCSLLTEFQGSETARALVVCGIPGIGKTTLLAKFVQDVRDQRNVYWYRVHEWVNLKILLTPIAEFLSQLGKKGLERYLSRTEGPSVGEVCAILEMEMQDLPTVFIIDDVQKADPTVQEFMAALIGVLEGLKNVSLICTSREIPSFYSRSLVFKGLVVELMLEGLDLDSRSASCVIGSCRRTS